MLFHTFTIIHLRINKNSMEFKLFVAVDGLEFENEYLLFIAIPKNTQICNK
jgi:hypothetical protein